MSVLYRWLTRFLRRVAPALARPGSKLHAGLAGRTDAHDTLAAWGRTARDPARPLFWFHAPSVGEGLQAQAVIDALRVARPDVQIAFTHFSPSASALAERIGADAAAYLPWDLPETVEPALDGLRPSAIVFTKTEVWPVLTRSAEARSIPVALIGGSVPDGSSRAVWPTRAFLRSTWGRLSLACANSAEDAVRLIDLGVGLGVARVTGDPGIDSAARRAGAADPSAPYLAPFRAVPTATVVAGSTWPSDEAVLVPALGATRAAVAGLRVVLAPHEPSEERVRALLEALAADGWRATTLGAVRRAGSLGDHDAVVVDSVGQLAHLYTIGDVAFVGGGFRDEGLHSVLEPAAAGIPIVIGPRHWNARAAGDLVRTGGAKIALNDVEMGRAFAGWLADGEARAAAGAGAWGYIDGHRGAAARTADLLKALIE